MWMLAVFVVLEAIGCGLCCYFSYRIYRGSDMSDTKSIIQFGAMIGAVMALNPLSLFIGSYTIILYQTVILPILLWRLDKLDSKKGALIVLEAVFVAVLVTIIL